MNTATPTNVQDLLSLLRLVESTPDGDLEWARHCTRQQAMILRLQTPGGTVTTLGSLATTTGIQIDVIEHMPVDGTAFPTRDGWRIQVSASLTSTARLQTALHELKHVIDHPLRVSGRDAGFNDADFEHLANYFAEFVLDSMLPEPSP